VIPNSSMGLAEAFYSTVGILEIAVTSVSVTSQTAPSTISPVKIANVLLGTRDSMVAYKISSRVREELQGCYPYAPVG
jgi:hypothetical protein